MIPVLRFRPGPKVAAGTGESFPGEYRLLEIRDPGGAPGQHLAELVDQRRGGRVHEIPVVIEPDHLPVAFRDRRIDGHPPLIPDAPGKALVQRTCGGPCHNLETALGMRRNRTGWTAMVDSMIARGANAKEAEAKAIVEYLTAHFGK